MWQKTMSPADMGKLVERMLGGDVTEDEFPSVEHLQEDFAVSLSKLMTDCCYGKAVNVVKVDGKINITIQPSNADMVLESSLWNHAGSVDDGSFQEMQQLTPSFCGVNEPAAFPKM